MKPRYLLSLGLQVCFWVALACVVLEGRSLPAPTNSIAYFGYFAADGKHGNGVVDYTAHTFQFTNLYIAMAALYDNDDPDWQTPFYNSLENAVANGKSIFLGTVGSDHTWGNQTITDEDIVDIASEFWSSVVMISISRPEDFYENNENTTAEDLEEVISEFEDDVLTPRELTFKPIYSDFTPNGAIQSDAINAYNLDIAGMQAFMLICGNGEGTPYNVNAMVDFLDAVAANVDEAEKQSMITMMAFDRYPGGPGCPDWTWDPDTLAALQSATYLHASTDPNVIGITMFAYGRHPGGTKDYPHLELYHRRMAAAMGLGVMATNTAIRGCSDYLYWSPVFKSTALACQAYCAENDADACEWNLNGDCYVEFGNGCYVESGYSSWYSQVLNTNQMLPNRAIRACQNIDEWSPVTKGSANACLSYCAENQADNCSWQASSGDCWVTFGDGCHVLGGFSGWYSTILRKHPGS